MSGNRETETVWSQVISLIGEEAAARLSSQFGGRELYVPASLGAGHPIAAIIGMDAALALSKRYASDKIDVPLSAGRRRRIIALAAQRMSRSAIARQVGCSERRVYQVLADADPQDPPADDQLDLFSNL